MLTVPNGQKCPADVIAAADMIAKIATGEIQISPWMTARTPASMGLVSAT
jgi:hypothetical protein